MIKKMISRRKFMKSGFFLVAGTAAGFDAFQKKAAQEIAGVSRTSLKRLRAIPTTCEQCPAGCGIIAYLNGERLVQLLGNPLHPNNQGGICAKGIAAINLVNDPERLLQPMKRIGSRGSGQWTKITWDEAYLILSKRFKEIMKSGRTNELVFDKGKDEPLFNKFISAVGSTNIIDRAAIKNLNRAKALTSMMRSESFIEDVGRSRTILNFGSNPYANHDHFIGIARRLVMAQVEKGARLFTFDVRMSETAAKSEAWYPIKSGTDGIVALAIANVIIKNGLADKDFWDRTTNYPLTMLTPHLSKYTPEAAEKESGINAAEIERLAVEFATQKPSLAMIGGGASEHENGSQNARCIALLNCLVGNLEKEGGIFYPRFPEETAPSQPTLKKSSKVIKGIFDLTKTNSRVDTYFAYLSNPIYEDPDCQTTLRLLKDEKIVPFLAVMDTHFTETAMMADVILPAATFLEGWGIKKVPSLDMESILSLRQPVISLLSDAEVLRSTLFDVNKLLDSSFKPRGEAKEIGNFCLEIAHRLGGKILASLPFKDTEDYAAKAASSSPLLLKQGGLKALKKNGFYIYSSNKRLSRANEKIEIYSNTLKRDGHLPLPVYQPVALHKKKNENEFILTPFKSNLITRGTANSKWAREILHENHLWINKESAVRLGIKNGERVRVISPVGSLITRVLTTHRIHPDSVALAEGLGHKAVGNIAKAKRFKSKDKDTNLLWWEKKGNGVNPNEIIEPRTDPISMGLGLKDTVVRIEKT
ncbi:MAG: molybdopterin-dependent oxidoreductase [Candidatus Aminicenantes bacterium]|nr:MAG: molybdopterin-dependent oxidoreductase [Candidatus Aminicenantes bacterium]